MNKTLGFLLLCFICFSGFSQSEITEKEIKDHILFLASEKNAGRYPGGKANKRVVRYLKKDFKTHGLIPFEKGYKQKFKANIRVAKGTEPKHSHLKDKDDTIALAKKKYQIHCFPVPTNASHFYI